MSESSEATVNTIPQPQANILEKPSTTIENFSLSPQIVDLSSILDSPALDEEQLAHDVFSNNRNWAYEFKKKWDALGRKVYAHPENKTEFYLVCPSTKEVKTVARVKLRNLRDLFSIATEDTYLYQEDPKQALSVKSLMPVKGKPPGLDMLPEANQGKTEEFNFSPSKNTVIFSEIETKTDVTRLLHEIGHSWGNYFELKGESSEVARSRTYDPVTEAEKRGIWSVVEEVTQIMLSERGANMLGKLVAAQPLVADNFGDFYTSEWQDVQEARYFAHYIQPLIDKYPDNGADIRKHLDDQYSLLAETIKQFTAKKS